MKTIRAGISCTWKPLLWLCAARSSTAFGHHGNSRPYRQYVGVVTQRRYQTIAYSIVPCQQTTTQVRRLYPHTVMHTAVVDSSVNSHMQTQPLRCCGASPGSATSSPDPACGTSPRTYTAHNPTHCAGAIYSCCGMPRYRHQWDQI